MSEKFVATMREHSKTVTSVANELDFLAKALNATGNQFLGGRLTVLATNLYESEMVTDSALSLEITDRVRAAEQAHNNLMRIAVASTKFRTEKSS